MNTKRLPLLLVVLIVGSMSLVLTACGDAASADEPPAVRYGEDTCGRCHMIVSDERFAAGLVDRHAEAMLFDDVGELILTVQDDGLNDRRAWVHDFDSGDWIDAMTAFYVDGHDIITPMGTGVVAFEDHAAATAHAADHAGMVRDWNGMLGEWTMHGHEHEQEQEQSQDHPQADPNASPGPGHQQPGHDADPSHDPTHDQEHD
jgi:copper chaperone NosL